MRMVVLNTHTGAAKCRAKDGWQFDLQLTAIRTEFLRRKPVGIWIVVIKDDTLTRPTYYQLV